ncbi:hypothetical protein D9611_002598 [Ephemerocybe angulata]|uniref:Uncharacterized protein n=2 Tax=Ephemerocybe angulata TaxID=980116 RepID=A0A8H5FDU5_9AGAR|nr:hypothetical protein D9611_002598 [Tulosesus angulatus]KAF6762125.1 hypothetical protein DFP72DRAFT_878051 [Tulosesus angulatus]
MPLFQDNPVRSAVAATAAVAVGHYVTMYLVSPNVSQLMQTFVAISAIGALVLLIILHHRQEGQLLTQDQEEYILIGGLALTWIVIVVAWRGLSGGGDRAGVGYPGAGGFSSPKGAAWPHGDYGQFVEEEYYDYY